MGDGASLFTAGYDWIAGNKPPEPPKKIPAPPPPPDLTDAAVTKARDSAFVKDGKYGLDATFISGPLGAPTSKVKGIFG